MRTLPLLVNHSVLELGKLAAVPAVGGADEIAGDALEGVNIVSVAMRTLLETFGCIFIAAIEAAVSVVIDTAVSDVVLVHQVDDVHNCLRIVCSVSVNLDVEDMAGALVLVVWSLNLSLVLRSAMVVHRNVA